MGKESLRPLFKKFGKINLLHFQKPTSATTSVTSMNNAVVGGQRIFVALTSEPVPSVKRGTAPAAPSPATTAKPTKSIAKATPVAAAAAPETTTASATDANKAFTKTCYHFRKGRCSKGDACTYVVRHVNTTVVHLSPCHRYLHTRKLCPTVEFGGVCTRMDECIYSHDPANAVPSATKSDVANKSQTLCHRIALGGNCSYGDKCRFSHDPDTALKGRLNVLCKNLAKGCRKGDKCWFSHDPTTAVAAKRPSEDSQAAETSVAAMSPPPTKKAKTGITSEFSKTQPATSSSENKSPAATCGECTKATATITCAQCEAGLCAACDASLHASRIMSKHVRAAVPQVEEAAPCGECRGAAATVHCVQCDVDYCSKCSWSVHEFKVFRTHRREALKVQTSAAVAVNTTAAPSASAKPSVRATSPTKTQHPTSNVRAYPKTELPNDSSDDSDEPPAKVQKPAAAASVKKTSVHTPKLELTSDSSSDESEVEANPAAKTTAMPSTKVTDLSSEDESDFDDEKPVVPVKKVVPAPKTALSSDSDDSSDDDEAANVSVKPTVPKTALSNDDGAVKQQPPAKKAAAVSADSSHSLVKKIEEYAASSSTDTLHLSPSLNSYERLLAHDCAERLGLSHESVGQGLERHITIGRGAPRKKSWSKNRS
ncbi:hypothetical protein DYB32_000459 [Aphanomyces invadans]|uniref:Zinc finger protein n=1 Tax=Aphanomyces invadans TaxID=157072 RepID=A0A418B9Z3_9STRA|nr:hypothetical protein DYB32_000459 [Aphanomyces invadans]